MDIVVEATLPGATAYRLIQEHREAVTSGNVSLVVLQSAGRYLLVVGDPDKGFTYPLSADVPVLRMAPGHFVLPFPGGLFYGVIVDRDVVETQALVAFEEALSKRCQLHQTVPAGVALAREGEGRREAEEAQERGEDEPLLGAEVGPGRTAAGPASDIAIAVGATGTGAVAVATTGGRTANTLHKVASGIDVGTTKAAEGIVTGATMISNGLSKGADFVVARVRPVDTPTVVPARVHSSLGAARTVTGAAVTLSAAAAESAMTMSKAIAGWIGQQISGGSNTGGTTTGQAPSSSGSQTKSAAKNVALASLGGLEKILDASFHAGAILLQGTGESTSKVVEHKYGDDVGAATRNGFGLVQDAALTARNTRRLGMGAMVRRTGIETSRGLLEEPGSTSASPSTSASLPQQPQQPQ